MFTTSFIRRSLAGTALVAISLLAICGLAAATHRSTDAEVSYPTTTTEVSIECTISTTTTIISITTSKVITTTTTTAQTTSMTEMVTAGVESQTTAVATETEPIIETQTEYVEPTVVTEESANTELPITEQERIMLCNLVGREYGSDWVSVYDKACVVAVVMNRCNSASFPNTIYDVLTQPNQFEGYLACDYYTYQVTDSCIEAVNYYFLHTDEFGNYLYFYGDGTRNYFY